jgi:hypothetical protein
MWMTPRRKVPVVMMTERHVTISPELRTTPDTIGFPPPLEPISRKIVGYINSETESSPLHLHVVVDVVTPKLRFYLIKISMMMMIMQMRRININIFGRKSRRRSKMRITMALRTTIMIDGDC